MWNKIIILKPFQGFSNLSQYSLTLLKRSKWHWFHEWSVKLDTFLLLEYCALCAFLSLYESFWVSLSLRESVRLMDSKKSLWESVNLYESLCAFLSLFDSLWVSVSLHESPWVSVSLRESPWVFVSLCESLKISFRIMS